MKTVFCILALLVLANAQSQCTNEQINACVSSRQTAGRAIAACADGVFPSVAAPECCPSCVRASSASCTSTQVQACQTNPPPFCTASQTQGPDPARPCCPNCIKSPCNADQQRACETATIPNCPNDGTIPTRDAVTCCPSCRVPPPPPTTCPPAPACATGVRPVLNDKRCYSCVPDNGIPDAPACTNDQLNACKATYAALPVCPAGQPPSRTPDCCTSCRVPESAACTNEKLTACRNSYTTTLPTCATGVQPTYNPTSCCVDCKPPTGDAKPGTDQRCTETAFNGCIEKTRVCNDGEEPVRDTTQCCPSCKRPERSCAPDTVAKCLRNAPVCPAGSRPAYVSGDCCPSCIPPPPTCDPACAAGSLCVPTDGAKGACKTRDQLAVKIRAAARFTGLGEGDIRALIREFFNRYCDKNENAADCKRFKGELDGISVDVKSKTDDNVDIIVNVPRSEGAKSAGAFNFFAAGSSTQVAAAAVNDPERLSEGFTVDYQGNGVSTVTPVAFLIAALAALVALMH